MNSSEILVFIVGYENEMPPVQPCHSTILAVTYKTSYAIVQLSHFSLEQMLF